MSAVSEQTIAVPGASTRAAQSTPCPQCSAPVEPGDTFCAGCGAPQAETLPAAAPSKAVVFRCENCGAEVRCDVDARTTACPFCAAPYVVEPSQRKGARQDPEFVLPFEVPPEKAEAIYRQWLGAGGLFRPGDLHLASTADGLRGIYLPFWSFSMRADSSWSASIGEHWYRTETYTETDSKGNVVTKTRQVQETEWWPLEGRHHAYYSFYLVSGSKGLPQGVAEWVHPFQLLGLKRYSPRYLPGWLTEEYSVEKAEARPSCEREFCDRERQAIAAFLPGDTSSGLQVETLFSKVDSDLILLPYYLRSYRYKGKLYRTLINGQTAKIDGQKPVSGKRIAAAVALVLALIALLYIAALLLGGGR